MEAPETITCVECGGTAHLITPVPDDSDVEPGTPLTYRCSDCGERMDLVMDLEMGEDGEQA